MLRCLKCFGQKAGSWACFSPCFFVCSLQSAGLSSVFLLQPPKVCKIALMKGNDTVRGSGFRLNQGSLKVG